MKPIFVRKIIETVWTLLGPSGIDPSIRVPSATKRAVRIDAGQYPTLQPTSGLSAPNGFVEQTT
jgi:hypothetical protein